MKVNGSKRCEILGRSPINGRSQLHSIADRDLDYVICNCVLRNFLPQFSDVSRLSPFGLASAAKPLLVSWAAYVHSRQALPERT